MEAALWPRPLTDLNLSQPAPAGNTCQGHCTHQSVPAHLTLEKGTCCVPRTSRPPRQPRPASVLPLLAPSKIHPCPKSLQDNVPLLVRHCTPQPIGWFPLNKGHHQTQCYIVLFLSFDTTVQKKWTITRVVEDVEKLEPLCVAGGNVKRCSHQEK